jgi:hypothetical protein
MWKREMSLKGLSWIRKIESTWKYESDWESKNWSELRTKQNKTKQNKKVIWEVETNRKDQNRDEKNDVFIDWGK